MPPPAAQTAAFTPSRPSLQSVDSDVAEQKTVLKLPNFGRFTGDWDDMVKRGHLRALVIYNRGGFYYDKGRPRGMVVEAMTEFERVINQKLKSRAERFIVDYISVPPRPVTAVCESLLCLQFFDYRLRSLVLNSKEHFHDVHDNLRSKDGEQMAQACVLIRFSSSKAVVAKGGRKSPLYVLTVPQSIRTIHDYGRA